MQTPPSSQDVCTTPTKPGRPRNPVWDDVDIDEGGMVYCLRCAARIHTLGFTHVERVKAHFKNKCAKRPLQRAVTAYFPVTLPASTKAQFDKKFAQWLYSTGMPFYKASHASCVEAMQVLNPAVQIPSQHALRGPLLNTCYQDSIDQLRATLAHRKCALVTDAWTDVNGLAVINYVAFSGSDTFFLESVYTGSESHDAPYLAGDVERIFDKYDFIEFVCLVTDNTSTNRCAWSLLQSKYPQLFLHGCVSHVLNLLVKDVVAQLPWLDTLLAQSKQLVSFLKKSQKLWYKIKQLQASIRAQDGTALPALVLPCDTRWGSILGCFDSLLQSEAVLLQMVTERDFLDGPTKKQKAVRRSIFSFVTSKLFLSHLKKAVELLRPLCVYQKRFEKNAAIPSDVC